MISIKELREATDAKVGNDTELDDLRQTVIAEFEAQTRRLWDFRAGYVEVLKPRNDQQRRLWLGLFPVYTITKVEERGRTESAWTEVASTDYKLTGRRTLQLVSGSFWDDEVRVTYNGGYIYSGQAHGTGDSPVTTDSDVKKALTVQAAFLNARNSDEKLVAASVAVEGASTSYHSPDFHPLFKAAVKRHRRKS